MKPRMPEDTLRCSFCHKTQDQVAKLIATPKRYPPAYICDECVAVCNSILAQDAGSKDVKKKESWVHRLKSWWTYSAAQG